MGKAWRDNAVASSPDFEVVAVVDIAEQVLNEAGEQLGVARERRFSDLKRALKRVEADAVLSLFLLLPTWASVRGLFLGLSVASVVMLIYGMIASGSRTAFMAMGLATLLWTGRRALRKTGASRLPRALRAAWPCQPCPTRRAEARPLPPLPRRWWVRRRCR